jgi:UDP-GlcNAc:undecaprenyl-phosphate/decaprenyl-phosphate GlcNAc-1-phosphate transferase
MLFISGVQVHLPVPGWLNLALTLFWVLGITNAFNLLDNIDGLCGGMGAVAAAYFLLLASLNGQYLVGAFAAALLGACVGFLIYNFNPARIFMGDMGSLFIGFLMAALGIKLRFPGNVPQVTWMIPILVLGVPIFDTTLVIVSRLRRGRNPLTTPGTDHVSHRLVRLDWTQREAVLLLYLAGCALGGIALFVSVATARTAYAVAMLVALATVIGILWLEYRTSQT